MDLLGTNGDGRYRVVEEDQVLRGIILMAWPLEARHEPAAAVRLASDALERLLALGLPYRREGRRRTFDFCEVYNLLKAAGLDGRDPTFREHIVPTSRRLTSESMGEPRPPPAGSGAHDPCRFEVTIRREFNLAGSVPGTPLRLRLPLPYEDPTQREITVEVVEPAATDVPVVRSPGRLEFRLPVPPSPARFAVEVRVAFTALQQSLVVERGQPRPFDRGDPETGLYTRPREGWIQVTPAVAALAASLTHPDDDPWTAVNAFWSFFFDRMRSGFIHHDELDRADPLRSLARRGWFDCLSGSALLVALCRARGIPARLVHGLILHEPSPCFHYWAEVSVPPHGWIPLDLTSWDLSAGRLGSDPWGRLFLGRMEYRMKCQCFPHLVVGLPGVRLPLSSYMLLGWDGEYTEASYCALGPPRLLFRDLVRISRRRPSPQDLR